MSAPLGQGFLSLTATPSPSAWHAVSAQWVTVCAPTELSHWSKRWVLSLSQSHGLKGLGSVGNSAPRNPCFQYIPVHAQKCICKGVQCSAARKSSMGELSCQSVSGRLASSFMIHSMGHYAGIKRHKSKNKLNLNYCYKDISMVYS